MATQDAALRAEIGRLLDWPDAHAPFDKVVDGVPERSRGERAPGLPHSLWQLLEHIRLAQHDILSFSVDASYHELEWPKDFWPAAPAPPSARAWDESIASYRRDREALQALATNPSIDLTSRVPNGDRPAQTYLRELLLVADHTSHHLAQMIDVRRALGIWTA
jgi:uncharacterized damage-inducible protein DinB